ncbi:hypothetical protein Pint_18742 [Pistacia integerrima]|uniref:Uncharacterized protein n=1 Tax=Pistacia integerrima TaxID=434235 RepID=A0ACC0YX95_9ROSI|nr:hypothetical protein Pint_18742 [Pistacia integerrima]
MALHLSPSFCLFSITITFILVYVPTSVSAIHAKYENCIAPFRCANLENIEYPFWGASRPEYCGYPSYRLDCEGEVAEISIMERSCRVLDINNSNGTLTVALEDYWDDLCPSNLVDGTLNSSFFNYTSDTENITLYYHCPPPVKDISAALLPFKFNCSSEETDTNNYYFIWGNDRFNSNILYTISNYFENCGTNVTIPVRQSAFLFLKRYPASANVSKALKEGFDLQWYANSTLCDKCKDSGGLCGFDTDTDEFTCYCPDMPYSMTCPSKGTSHLFIHYLCITEFP